MKEINLRKNLISTLIAASLMAINATSVFADECESTYGGGETCLVNKRFEIKKEVQVCEKYNDANREDCKTWGELKDKVTDVEENDLIRFVIKVTNLSDEEAGSFDDMKMTDFLPDEIRRIGGDKLVEKWDDFEVRDDDDKNSGIRRFYIEAVVNDSEYDRKNFEKCVVNKAEIRWDGKFEGADTATVCYQDIRELPKTGGGLTTGLLGLGFMSLGLLIKKSKNA